MGRVELSHNSIRRADARRIDRGAAMSTFRLLPVAAVLLAGGCVTDYGYHQATYGGGDYYVGTPRVAYGAPYGAYSGYVPYVDPGIYGYGYGWYGWYRGSAYPGPYPYPGGYPYWGNPYWRTTYWGGHWGPSIHYHSYYGGGYYGGPHYRYVGKPHRPPPPTPPTYVHRMNPRDGVIPPRVTRPPSTVVRPRPTTVVPPPTLTPPPTSAPSAPPRPTPVVPNERPVGTGTPARQRVRVRTVDPRAD